jgi:hypothetical protein
VEPTDLIGLFSTFLFMCFPIIFGFGIFGAVIFWIIRRSQQAKALREASQNWPTTTGKVLKSRAEVRSGRHTRLHPYVLYEYDVNGQSYQNDHVRASDKLWRGYASREAYDTVDRYPVGATVTVYYNSADPQQSALEH